MRETVQQLAHRVFIWRLTSAVHPIRYTDGGPSDLQRQRKRNVGKRQRQARKKQRGSGQ